MATRSLPFQWLLHRVVGEGATPFLGLLHFTLDTYLILLSVKQGGIKYHFKSFWYDVTRRLNPLANTLSTWPINSKLVSKLFYFLCNVSVFIIWAFSYIIEKLLERWKLYRSCCFIYHMWTYCDVTWMHCDIASFKEIFWKWKILNLF